MQGQGCSLLEGTHSIMNSNSNTREEEDDADLWQRIVEKRRKDCEGLSPATQQHVLELLLNQQQESDDDSADDVLQLQHPAASVLDRMEHGMRNHLLICSNESLSPRKRRTSWKILELFFRTIDREREKSHSSSHSQQQHSIINSSALISTQLQPQQRRRQQSCAREISREELHQHVRLEQQEHNNGRNMPARQQGQGPDGNLQVPGHIVLSEDEAHRNSQASVNVPSARDDVRVPLGGDSAFVDATEAAVQQPNTCEQETAQSKAAALQFPQSWSYRSPIRRPARKSRQSLPSEYDGDGRQDSVDATSGEQPDIVSRTIRPTTNAVTNSVVRGKTLAALKMIRPTPNEVRNNAVRGKTLAALTIARSCNKESASIAAAAPSDENGDGMEWANERDTEKTGVEREGSFLALCHSDSGQDGDTATAETSPVIENDAATTKDNATATHSAPSPAQSSIVGKKLSLNLAKQFGSYAIASRDFLIHTRSRRATSDFAWTCTLCPDVKILYEACLISHCRSRKHQENLAKLRRVNNKAPAKRRTGASPMKLARTTHFNEKPDPGIVLDYSFSVGLYWTINRQRGVQVPRDDLGRKMCIVFHKNGLCYANCSMAYDHTHHGGRGAHSAGETARLVEYIEHINGERVFNTRPDDGIILDPLFSLKAFRKQIGSRRESPMDDHGRLMCLFFHKNGICYKNCGRNYDHTNTDGRDAHSVSETTRLIAFLGDFASSTDQLHVSGLPTGLRWPSEMPSLTQKRYPLVQKHPTAEPRIAADILNSVSGTPSELGPQGVSNKPAWMTRQQHGDAVTEHQQEPRAASESACFVDHVFRESPGSLAQQERVTTTHVQSSVCTNPAGHASNVGPRGVSNKPAWMTRQQSAEATSEPQPWNPPARSADNTSHKSVILATLEQDPGAFTQQYRVTTQSSVCRNTAGDLSGVDSQRPPLQAQLEAPAKAVETLSVTATVPPTANTHPSVLEKPAWISQQQEQSQQSDQSTVDGNTVIQYLRKNTQRPDTGICRTNWSADVRWGVLANQTTDTIQQTGPQKPNIHLPVSLTNILGSRWDLPGPPKPVDQSEPPVSSDQQMIQQTFPQKPDTRQSILLTNKLGSRWDLPGPPKPVDQSEAPVSSDQQTIQQTGPQKPDTRQSILLRNKLGSRWDLPGPPKPVDQSEPPVSSDQQTIQQTGPQKPNTHQSILLTNKLGSRWIPPGPPKPVDQSEAPVWNDQREHPPPRVVNSSTANLKSASTFENEPREVRILAVADRRLQDRRRNTPMPTFACSLKERDLTRVLYKASRLEHDDAQMFRQRQKDWDPFWRTMIEIRRGVTSKVQRCSPHTVLINSAASEEFSIPSDFPYVTSIDWGRKRDVASEPWKNGDMVLLLRSLPANRNTCARYRADCHLWPKGTFLQINGRAIRLVQRKQQAHDEAQWKGMCYELNVSQYIDNPTQPSKIEFCCFDTEPFLYSLSICTYVDADHIYKGMVCAGTEEAIHRIPLAEARKKAIEFVASQKTVTIDSDVEDEDEDVAKFILSLTCPISKQIMNFPVRGKTCKHWQCFDLLNYIQSNAVISGNRWRCVSCEDFVSLRNLEYCGLTAGVLEEFKDQATVDRNRVEFCANGSYQLLDERQLRYKRPPSHDDFPFGRDEKRVKPNQVEVNAVVLDDDDDVIVID